MSFNHLGFTPTQLIGLVKAHFKLPHTWRGRRWLKRFLHDQSAHLQMHSGKYIKRARVSPSVCGCFAC
jgi:hypothetical protein